MLNDATRRVEELVKLPSDSAYFDFGESERLALEDRLNALFGEAGVGLPPPEPAAALPFLQAIGAPRSVTLGNRSSLPVIVASRQSERREWMVHSQYNTLFVITQRGETRFCPSFLPEKRLVMQPSGTGAPPSKAEEAHVWSSISRFELIKACELELVPGRLAITVVVYDQVSNTAVIDVTVPGAQAAPPPPRAASAFLAPASAPPSTQGVALSLPEKTARGPIPVQGAISLPAKHAPLAQSPSGALLLATLFAVKLDAPRPIAIDLAIPAAVHGAEVHASFSFDLLRATDALAPGTYQVYLLAGDRITGPRPLTLGQ